MGDTGSLFLGFTLAAVGIKLRFPENSGVRHLDGAGAVLAVPIFDTTLVIISRLRRGLNPLTTPGKDHISHRLARITGSPREAVLICYLLGGVGGVIATFVTQASIFEGYVVGSAWSFCVGCLRHLASGERATVRSITLTDRSTRLHSSDTWRHAPGLHDSQLSERLTLNKLTLPVLLIMALVLTACPAPVPAGHCTRRDDRACADADAPAPAAAMACADRRRQRQRPPLPRPRPQRRPRFRRPMTAVRWPSCLLRSAMIASRPRRARFDQTEHDLPGHHRHRQG